MLTQRYEVRFERNVDVPVRDGTILRADLYRPDAPGPFPTLVQRTPYNKAFLPVVYTLDPLRAAGAGYAVLNQDTRGRFASDGEFRPFRDEAEDGYDTVEWVAAQPWCTGKVGMLGASYVGANQLHAAALRPPHLAAIAPWITGADYHEGWTYQGGAFCLGFNLNWTLTRLAPDVLRRRGQSTDDLVAATDGLSEAYRRLPLADVPELREAAPFYADWLAHPDDGPYWRAIRIADSYDRIGVPAFHLGAWYDIFLTGTLRNYAGLRAAGGAQQKLLVGPWVHSVELSNLAGEVDFGVGAGRYAFDLDGLLLRWFDRWLKDERNGADDEPPVRIFVMGANTWRDEREWPLARAVPTTYYLHGRGGPHAGLLSTEPPGDEPPEVYLADPHHPVPTRGGPNCCYPAQLPSGAYDQRSVEARPDVLVYTTPPLDRALEVTGPIEVVLYASTSAPDTDFTAKLVDVYPDGYARNLTDGILRGRYREGTDRSRLLTPGRVYEYRIDAGATSTLFKRGHRIRLEIASSNFPRFDRNPQTGEPAAEARVLAPALQTVHHERAYPSRVVLPLVPTEG
jgi:putative CocE/NonD family hydrolase